MPGPTLEKRGEGAMPILVGYLNVFDEWARVESGVEGRFMERTKPGAFAKTIKENREQMRVLFHHGMNPSTGVLPLGTIDVLEEQQRGCWYESKLFNTKYVDELLPALEAGQFGSSYTFRPVKEEPNYRPQRSSYNPDALPEITLLEVRMREFGPCMFPVYKGTSAGVRSTTDELMLERLSQDPLRLSQLLGSIAPQNALSTERAEATHSQREEPRTKATAPIVPKSLTDEEWLTWLSRNRTSIR